MTELESRIHELVDDRLFKVFADAAAHFNTSDLVLVLNQSDDANPLNAYSREKLIASPNIPEFLRNKLQRPARDTAVRLGSGDAAFWLVVFFDDGESACVSLNAKLIGPGGNA
jgi:hypothetical protein